MEKLFTSSKIGTLELPNRLIRSATAESMADVNGHPTEKLTALYQQLTRGGVGLIITGHMNVHPSGRAHPNMTGIYHDDHIPGLSKLVDAVHRSGGKVAVQINHAGMHARGEGIDETIAPSKVLGDFVKNTPREMTIEEIDLIIDSFAQAAQRAKESGFDAVQVHAAHSYLVGQFLSPLSNKREDIWGGDLNNRMRFLREVSAAVREQVGPDYPLLIKLGMMDGREDGLTLDEGLRVVAVLEEMGYDGIELSGGFGGKKLSNVRKGVRKESEEAYFLEFAKKAKQVTNLPILLVGGFRSRSVMESVLANGEADFISLCRPLINDPDFPNKLRSGELSRSECLSANNCWAEEPGDGIACKCPIEKVK
ncbi:MAG: NADH:flavin oxidoreductase [Chloroflexi bacterium]|nr:NADH:flavin oxidoreductase [Chloroflexota bacterium]MBT3668867.1 NADH:flavin oxidoreductase [Chloroflexota bacterium]MBT4004216.1 NADH:flavin oxidoreductase [Chloroflexota bacterium]MBT4306581.1 NADH:flavin oxidoreductase [Chloroflexota bacterium]MBT4533965.1 NADH:flavin oxidoreductase [Chloroflexota bacterium]